MKSQSLLESAPSPGRAREIGARSTGLARLYWFLLFSPCVSCSASPASAGDWTLQETSLARQGQPVGPRAGNELAVAWHEPQHETRCVGTGLDGPLWMENRSWRDALKPSVGGNSCPERPASSTCCFLSPREYLGPWRGNRQLCSLPLPISDKCKHTNKQTNKWVCWGRNPAAYAEQLEASYKLSIFWIRIVPCLAAKQH